MSRTVRTGPWAAAEDGGSIPEGSARSEAEGSEKERGVPDGGRWKPAP